jgi:Phytanoyl-CoA dioxygenase (PhyH)
MTLGARVRSQLAKQAPRLEEVAVRAHWRRRNAARSFDPDAVTDPVQRECIDALHRDGYAVCRFEDLFGGDALFKEADAEVQRLYAERPPDVAAAAGSKESFLTKLASAHYPADHPFVRIALDPRALNVANGYLRLRSTLRAIELWYTRPTPGAAVQTQLWHRDADDVMNVKMFIYFTEVTIPAGPLTYAPGTHPVGKRRKIPEHDSQRRSTDEQMAEIVPDSEWRILEGAPGTVVFADTCGYHKQLKPTTGERLKLVSQYVSGTPYVPPALELEGIDAARLSDDQHYAVFDRPRS